MANPASNSLIGWVIFTFSEIGERKSTTIDMKHDPNNLYQSVVFRADRKSSFLREKVGIWLSPIAKALYFDRKKYPNVTW